MFSFLLIRNIYITFPWTWSQEHHFYQHISFSLSTLESVVTNLIHLWMVKHEEKFIHEFLFLEICIQIMREKWCHYCFVTITMTISFTDKNKEYYNGLLLIIRSKVLQINIFYSYNIINITTYFQFFYTTNSMLYPFVLFIIFHLIEHIH